MKIIRLFVGMSVSSVQLEIEKIQAEAGVLEQKEEELFSKPSVDTNDFQNNFLINDKRKTKLASKANCLISTTLSFDLYRTFRMLGLKVTHPLRFILSRFLITALTALVIFTCFFYVKNIIYSSEGYKKNQSERHMVNTTKAYYKALQKKNSTETSIKLNAINSWEIFDYIEESNEAISDYNNMLSFMPVEKRGDLRVIEYIAAK